MAQALQRGIAVLRRRGAAVDIPSWVTCLNFIHASSSADPWAAGAIIVALRAAEHKLRTRSCNRAPAQARWPVEPVKEVGALPPWAAPDRAPTFGSLAAALPSMVQQLNLQDGRAWQQWAQSDKCEAEFPPTLPAAVTPFQRVLLVQARSACDYM